MDRPRPRPGGRRPRRTHRALGDGAQPDHPDPRGHQHRGAAAERRPLGRDSRRQPLLVRIRQQEDGGAAGLRGLHGAVLGGGVGAEAHPRGTRLRRAAQGMEEPDGEPGARQPQLRVPLQGSGRRAGSVFQSGPVRSRSLGRRSGRRRELRHLHLGRGRVPLRVGAADGVHQDARIPPDSA
jgi:hypothetical protein